MDLCVAGPRASQFVFTRGKFFALNFFSDIVMCIVLGYPALQLT